MKFGQVARYARLPASGDETYVRHDEKFRGMGS